MKLVIHEGDLFALEADGIFLPIDGEGTDIVLDRRLGNVARALDRKFPELEVADEIEAQVDFPLVTEMAEGVELAEERPFRVAVVLSILYHQGVLSTAEKKANVSRALRVALGLCQDYGLASVATPLLSGGWRLPAADAFRAMLDGLRGHRGAVPECVTVCVLDGAAELRALAEAAGFAA